MPDNESKRSLPRHYTLTDFNNDLKTLRDPLSFGYSSLQRLRIFPGSLTVVTAPTGGGKTAFLLNVLLNLLRDHPESRFAFWSYEEPAHLILAKLQMIAVSRLGKDHSFPDTETALHRIRSRRGLSAEVRERLEQVEGYIKGKRPRLLLMQEHLDSTRLMGGIESLHDKHKFDGLFLDYVQQVPSGVPQSSGYLGIKLVVNALRKVATSKRLPVIVAAQVSGTDANLRTREGRDIEMDASLWIHLDIPKAAGEDHPKYDRRTIKVLKHRYGSLGAPIDLHFEGKSFAFTEPNQPTGELLTTLPSEIYLHESMRTGDEHDETT